MTSLLEKEYEYFDASEFAPNLVSLKDSLRNLIQKQIQVFLNNGGKFKTEESKQIWIAPPNTRYTKTKKRELAAAAGYSIFHHGMCAKGHVTYSVETGNCIQCAVHIKGNFNHRRKKSW